MPSFSPYLPELESMKEMYHFYDEKEKNYLLELNAAVKLKRKKYLLATFSSASIHSIRNVRAKGIVDVLKSATPNPEDKNWLEMWSDFQC